MTKTSIPIFTISLAAGLGLYAVGCSDEDLDHGATASETASNDEVGEAGDAGDAEAGADEGATASGGTGGRDSEGEGPSDGDDGHESGGGSSEGDEGLDDAGLDTGGESGGLDDGGSAGDGESGGESGDTTGGDGGDAAGGDEGLRGPCERTQLRLLAGQYLEVGLVTVDLYPGFLELRVETQAPWLLEQVHVYVGEDVPGNNPGSYNVTADLELVESYLVTVDVSEFECGAGFMAVHAEVASDLQTEGAWAYAEQGFEPGWGSYFELDPCCP